jgi:hypothetical protein
MKGLTGLVLVLTAIVAVAVATASAGSTPTPVLSGGATMPDGVGGGGPPAKGFGRVRPREIFFGGDPSGLVCHISWTSWGGQFAVGTGTGLYIGPHQGVSQGHPAPAVIVLYHLATWHGRPAYTRLNWYFPQGGSTYGGVSHCSA